MKIRKLNTLSNYIINQNINNFKYFTFFYSNLIEKRGEYIQILPSTTNEFKKTKQFILDDLIVQIIKKKVILLYIKV